MSWPFREVTKREATRRLKICRAVTWLLGGVWDSGESTVGHLAAQTTRSRDRQDSTLNSENWTYLDSQNTRALAWETTGQPLQLPLRLPQPPTTIR